MTTKYHHCTHLDHKTYSCNEVLGHLYIDNGDWRSICNYCPVCGFESPARKEKEYDRSKERDRRQGII